MYIFFFFCYLFFLKKRRPPRSTLDRSSAASDVYKRQVKEGDRVTAGQVLARIDRVQAASSAAAAAAGLGLSLIHISEPTRPY